MKPTENEANAARVPVNGSNEGKKTSLNTRAAAVPKMKKSYHSIVVPIEAGEGDLARRAQRRLRGGPGWGVDVGLGFSRLSARDLSSPWLSSAEPPKAVESR